MKALGDVDFSYLFLKDGDLGPCRGCYVCFSKGEDQCPLRDARPDLERELLESDGIILSTPLHVMNVSTLMTNFINRFAYANHRPKFHRQKVMSVVNMGGDNPKAAFSLLRYALGGSRVVRELGVATPPWPSTRRALARSKSAIEAAATAFFRDCANSTLPPPSLTGLIRFHSGQMVYRDCEACLPADFAFYKDRRYFYEAEIPGWKSALARIIVGTAMKFMKDRLPGGSLTATPESGYARMK
jgi:hypothetical protein